MKKIKKIFASYIPFGQDASKELTWSRENIGDMIELIPEKMEKEGGYVNIRIVREEESK